MPSTEHHEVKLDETQAQPDHCGGEFGVARPDGSFLTNKYCINKYALRETNSSPLKIGHPKRNLVFQLIFFQVLCYYVSFREGK